MFRRGGATTGSGGANLNGVHGLTADDLEVSEILLSLPRLIYSSVRWASKKKRSAIKSRPSLMRPLLLPPPVPGSPKRKPKSPTTPLDLPIESDEKNNDATRKNFKRKSREELREEIATLEKRRKVYKELERVGAHQKHLLAYNETLRAKKFELLQLVFFPKSPDSETPEEVIPKSSSPTSSGDHLHIQSKIHEAEPLTGLQSSAAVLPYPTCSVGPSCSSAVRSHLSISVGPVWRIPDLNVPAYESHSPWIVPNLLQ